MGTGRIRVAAGLVLLSLLLLGQSGCGSGNHGAGAPTTARSRATSVTSTAPMTTTTTTEPALPPPPPVSWTPCRSGLQCGSVGVPLDYGHPEGATIEIALARHPAGNPSARIGSLVINPGGPGGSGIDDLPEELSVLSPQLLADFDIVSFDPRGVGASDPVHCSDPTAPPSGGGLPQNPLPDPIPSTPAAQGALLGEFRAYAAGCARYSGSLLAFVGTVDVARDLDRIRAALGDPLLTYIGHSYGTLLGATYAELFPTGVRAMVLDGAIDPALSLEELSLEQAEGFETVLGDFFTWCLSAGCAWHPAGDPTTAVLGLIQSSRTQALAGGGGRVAGPGEFYDALLDSLYSRSGWAGLGQALADAEGGNGSGILALSDRYNTAGAPNAGDASTAINCADHPTSTDTGLSAGWAQTAAAAAPVFGPLLAWGDLGCAVWPTPASRVPGPATATGSPAILVTGTTKDPATPYGWAVSLAGELAHGVLVTRVGEDHVAYFYSSCVRSIDEAYLVAGTVPAPDTVCSS